MLIRFVVSNFLSFLEEQELSLYPSRVRLHKSHIFKTKTTKTNILKSAMIYGANSSGKSNLLKAIYFARKLIVKGSPSKQFINIPTFKLSINENTSSKFIFEIYINNQSYEYGFEIQNRLISKEWLKKTYKYDEKVIYLREIRDNISKLVIKPEFKNKDIKQVFENTTIEIKNNQLLLTILNSKKPEVIDQVYKDVFYWFSEKLKIIFPDTKLYGIQLEIMKRVELISFYNKYLKLLDTGIDGISFHEYDFYDANVTIPKFIKEDIENELDDENHIVAVSSDENENYCVERKNGKLIAHKLKTIHKKFDAMEDIEFDFNEESDGTNRIFDLAPIFFASFDKNNVVLIDEIDRSLHSLIPEKIFELFFNYTINKPSQLIVTTHDLNLLDLSKFRRDEIWFIKKDFKLQSILYSLEEFKTRYDKELKKAYLAGRYGAIPILGRIYQDK